MLALHKLLALHKFYWQAGGRGQGHISTSSLGKYEIYLTVKKQYIYITKIILIIAQVFICYFEKYEIYL